MHNSSIIKFALKSIILLAITFTIFAAIFLLVATSEIQPDTSMFYSDYYDYLNNKGDADILIVGNSRALSSLSSAVITSQLHKKTYNMAYRAANMDFTKDLLTSYISSALRKPSVCILEVSWFSFNTKRTSYIYNKPQLVFKFKGWEKLLANAIAQRPTLIEQAVNAVKPHKYNYVDWWDGDPKKEPSVFDPTKFDINAMYKVFPKLEAGIDTKLYNSYEEIISICKINNIKLILYTSPEAPIYTSHQKDKLFVKSIIQKSAHDNNLEYFDFTADGPYYGKDLDGMLYNPVHVRKAIEFTKYFLATLKRKKSI